MRAFRGALSLGILAFCAASSLATVRQVGPGGTYTTVQAAANACVDGDIIEIDSGNYLGSACCASFSDSNLTIRGVGAILRFDVSSIPTGATVRSATLYVYAYDQNAWRSSTGYYGAYPLTRSFNVSQVTWNIAASGVNWTTAGGDFSATADATAPKQGTASVWYSFDVTSRVQSMVSTPSGNYGWVLKCTDENLNNQAFLTSSPNSDTTHRPKLVMTYGSPPLEPDSSQAGDRVVPRRGLPRVRGVLS